MSDTLILDSLKVSGFRGFENLEVPKLGRVNLITGKNNVGKTGLLEALQVYARRGEPNVLQSLLVRRDEMYFSNNMKANEMARLLDNVKAVFHGRPELDSSGCRLVVGDLHEVSNQVTVSVERFAGEVDDGGQQTLFVLDDDEVKPVLRNTRVVKVSVNERELALGFSPSTFRGRFVGNFLGEEIPHTFIWSRGLDVSAQGRIWDQIALSAAEDEVIAALQIISPSLMRVNLVSARDGNPERVPMVRLSEQALPVPMKSLGEGMNRMFGLSLALVSSGGGLLLVDEIEIGLHHSVQAEMWRLIFKTAQRLDIQVFATTHSKDCYEAFAQVAREESGAQGVLIRLENKKGRVVAVPFNEGELDYVVNDSIEVR